MTGAEHYEEAERILARIANGDILPEDEAHFVSVAQAHATLALTQATLATFEAADWDKS